MRLITTPAGPPGNPANAAQQPAPSGRPRVEQPLPQKAQLRTQQSTQDLRRSPPDRHIANQTTPTQGTSPQPKPDVLFVIAGYTLTKKTICRSDGTPLPGLHSQHVLLVSYLRDRLDKLITETELKGVIGVGAESTVATYLRQLPPTLGIERKPNALDVKCWVMGASKTDPAIASGEKTASRPKGIALDPDKRYYLEKGPPSVLWVNRVNNPLNEHGFATLAALHEGGEQGVYTKAMATSWDVEEANVLTVLMGLRHHFPVDTILIEPGTRLEGSLCRFRWPAVQPRLAMTVSPSAVKAELDQLNNQATDIVNAAAIEIEDGLNKRQWARVNGEIKALSAEIEKFIRRHGTDQDNKPGAAVSSPVMAIEMAILSIKNLVLRAHIMGGCHCFGMGIFPVRLLRLLRCGPPGKLAIKVVKSRERDLLSGPTRALALKNVLIHLSWLEIPWITSDSSRDAVKQFPAIQDEIKNLLELLGKAQTGDECAAIVSCLKDALAPEYCSLSLARRLAKAPQVPRWLGWALNAAVAELESNANEHLGAVRSSHPFAVHSFGEQEGSKRKRSETEDERAKTRARPTVGDAFANTNSTPGWSHFNLPNVLPPVSMSAHLSDVPRPRSDTPSAQRLNDLHEGGPDEQQQLNDGPGPVSTHAREDGFTGLSPSEWFAYPALSTNTNTNTETFFESPMSLDSGLQDFTLMPSDFVPEQGDMGYALPGVQSPNTQNLESRHEDDDFNVDDLNPDYW